MDESTRLTVLQKYLENDTCDFSLLEKYYRLKPLSILRVQLSFVNLNVFSN